MRRLLNDDDGIDKGMNDVNSEVFIAFECSLLIYAMECEEQTRGGSMPQRIVLSPGGDKVQELAREAYTALLDDDFVRRAVLFDRTGWNVANALDPRFLDHFLPDHPDSLTSIARRHRSQFGPS